VDFTRRTDALRLPRAVTRLVALGDPHGSLGALEAVLAREERPDTAFVSVGDNVGYQGGRASSDLVRALEARAIASVFGNHESWLRPDGTLFLTHGGPDDRKLDARALAWCEALPFRLAVEAEAAPALAIAVVHTLCETDDAWDYVTPATVERLVAAEEVDVILSGHSHRPAIHVIAPGRAPERLALDPSSDAPVVAKLRAGVRYVADAGSLSRPELSSSEKFLDRGTYAVLDLAAGTLAVHAFGREPT
jgi:predicted phosphodiesterase